MVAVVLSRNWRLSWWEWHVLMLRGVRRRSPSGPASEYRRSGTLAGAFGGLYLEATLARIDRWHAGAIAAVAAAEERGESTDQVLAGLRREGASSDEVALLVQAARRAAPARRVVPALPAERDPRGDPSASIRRRPARRAGARGQRAVRRPGRLHDLQRDALADRGPDDAQRVLGEASCRPSSAAGGVIEHFAGDGVMAIFNADRGPARSRPAGPPRRAARSPSSAARWRRATRAGRCSGSGSTPGCRSSATSGPPERRSFASIGDTTNVAARLVAVGEPGQVVVARATWEALGAGRQGDELGPTRVKGKQAPVEAWVLRATAG